MYTANINEPPTAPGFLYNDAGNLTWGMNYLLNTSMTPHPKALQHEIAYEAYENPLGEFNDQTYCVMKCACGWSSSGPHVAVMANATMHCNDVWHAEADEIWKHNAPKKISAIKDMRQISGMGLKAAKEVIEMAIARNPGLDVY